MITEWIHTALTYIGDHPTFGLVFSFIISFAESFPIVGTIIPGSFTMTAVGTLVGIGVLPLYPTLICASIGAFCGDLGGYALGLLGEGKLSHIWPFKYALNWVEYGKGFFRKHGGKSIVIGRFFGPIRSTVPLIASLLGLPFRRFVVAAVPSAILWAIVYTGPGILLGHYSVHIQAKDIGKFIALGIGGVVGFAALFWLSTFIGARIKAYFYKRIEPFWLKHKVTNSFIYRFFQMQNEPNNPLGISILWILLAWIIATCILISIPADWLQNFILHPLQHVGAPLLKHHSFQNLLIGLAKANNLLHLTLIAIVIIFASFCCLNKKQANLWLISYGLCLFAVLCLITTLLQHPINNILYPAYQMLALGSPYILMLTVAPSRYNLIRRIISIVILLWIILSGIAMYLLHSISLYNLIIGWSLGCCLLYGLLLINYRLRNIDQTNRLDSICLIYPVAIMITLACC